MKYALTQLYTGITPPRLANIIAYSWVCSDMPGAFAEFGVMKGGSLELLARLHPKRQVYGIDGFEGLPEPTACVDTHKKGEFGLTDDEFRYMEMYFHNFHPNVKIVKGYSPKVFEAIDDKFSFVHVDVDMYQSVKDALAFFYPRLIESGIMLFDDYGFDSTPGAKQALDEWFVPSTWSGELRLAGDLFTGQYLIIK
jgi:hypothetical protein